MSPNFPQSLCLRAIFDSQPNSLNLARHVLASIVVYSHAFETGGYGLDPLKVFTGFTSGDICVAFFFAISGYLVCRSWFRNPSGKIYLWHRSLRIFPAFWVCLILTSFVLFPLWIRISGEDFGGLELRETWSYLFSNFLLRIRQSSIGNMFAANPVQGVVNGSLWSLFPEFLCYLLVLFAGKLGFFKRNMSLFVVLAFLLCLAFAATPFVLTSVFDTRLYPPLFYVGKLVFVSSFFVCGILLFLLSGKVRVSYVGLFIALTAFVGSLICGFKPAVILLPFLAPYIAISGSLLFPFKGIKLYSDFSYGIYIYHFPVQQVLYAFGFLSGLNVVGFALCSWFLTLPLAVLSWLLVEKVALKQKNLLSC